MVTKAGKINLKKTISSGVLVFTFLFLVSEARAIGPFATTTLTVSPSATVNAGTVVTFTATVSFLGSPQTAGQVTFCDLNVGCGPNYVLGQSQLTSSGVATFKMVLGAGAHNIQAITAATQSFPGSQSAPQTVTVVPSPIYKSTMALAGTGQVGQYNLATSMAAFGTSAPTGTVSFLDASNGNSLISSTNLNPTGANPTFVAPSSLPATGKGSYSAVSADFNNDGFADLAVANSGDSTVTISLGKGDGTFRAPVAYQTDATPVWIAMGDFNGDGFQDLATANSAGSSISILLGNGDGTFRASQNYALSSPPSFIAVNDVNLDADADLILANTSGNSVSVLFGNGDGTFRSVTNYATGQAPTQLAIADVNNDGWPDIVTADSLANSVGVLLGAGDGSFANPVSYPAGFETHAVAIGDLNGDGNLDIVAANYGGGAMSVMLGNGDGSFQPESIFRVGRSPYHLILADLNHDGFLDAAVANATDNSVSVLFGTGTGSFQRALTFPVGTMPTAIVAADFNGDGMTDLAVSSFTSASTGSLSILLSAHALQAEVPNVSVIGRGTHNIVAIYSGDSVHAGTSSQPVSLQGLTFASMTTLTSSLTTARQGDAIRFTSAVSSHSGLPTGSVTFLDGTKSLGTVTLNGGQAQFSTAGMTAGKHTITASYSGDERFSASTSVAVSVEIEALVPPIKVPTVR